MSTARVINKKRLAVEKKVASSPSAVRPLDPMQSTPDIDYKRLYEETQVRCDESQIRIISLERQLSQLQKMIFGSRHERFVPADQNPSQLSLDITAEPVAACSVIDARKISYVKTSAAVEAKPLAHPGRMKLPEGLRREEIIIEPAADRTDCKKIGDEITEILEYAPGELFVKKISVQSTHCPKTVECWLVNCLSDRLRKQWQAKGCLHKSSLTNTLTTFLYIGRCNALKAACKDCLFNDHRLGEQYLPTDHTFV